MLDEEIFQQSTMGDPHLGRLVVDAFLKTTPQLLADFEAAEARGNDAEARRAIHSLKGSSMTLGIHPLSRACRILEETFDNGTRRQADTLHEVRELFDRARVLLRERFDLDA